MKKVRKARRVITPPLTLKEERAPSTFNNPKGFELVLCEDIFKRGDVVAWDSRDNAVIKKVYKRTRWRKFWTRMGFDMGLVSTGIKYKVKLIS